MASPHRAKSQPQTTTCPSDAQSDSPLGLALAKLALAATDYHTALIGSADSPNIAWSKARAEVLAAALEVGWRVEQEVRQVADGHRPWPVTSSGDKHCT